MTIYGWYSEESFIINKIGYLYSDKVGNPQLCTIVSGNSICPYYQPLNKYNENVIFVGEVLNFIQPVHYRKEELNELVIDIYKNTKVYEEYYKSMENRLDRFNRIKSSRS